MTLALDLGFAQGLGLGFAIGFALGWFFHWARDTYLVWKVFGKGW